MKAALATLAIISSVVSLVWLDHREESVPLSANDASAARLLYQQRCAACHGPDLQGAVGPELTHLGSRRSFAKIEKILLRGKGRKKTTPMPGGLVNEQEARLLAAWLLRNPTR